MLIRCLFGILQIIAVSGTIYSQGRTRALTPVEVERLVFDLPDSRLASELRSLGITQPFRKADLERLIAAGVGLKTQAVLRDYLVKASVIVSVTPVIQGAMVRVGNQSAITDEGGRAFLDGLESGNYQLTVEKLPAVLRTDQWISLPEGRNVIHISLQVVKGKLSVIAPVQNASLEIAGVGRFSLPLRDYELPAGTYAVSILAPAYLPYRADVDIQGSELKVVRPSLVPDRAAMVKYVAESEASLQQELQFSLQSGDVEGFRSKAGLVLDS